MKKLFISCPMKGRTEENIKKSIEKMHKIAELIFDQELEIINNFYPGLPDGFYNTDILKLGYNIKYLASADFFIGIADWTETYKGCVIERDVAMQYNIPRTLVSMQELMPDAVEVERARYGYGEVTLCKCEPEACDNVEEEK